MSMLESIPTWQSALHRQCDERSDEGILVMEIVTEISSALQASH
jgi:hypothetical protein